VRLLIRYMQSRDKAQHEFDGSVVTIGRGTDQTIQIADNSLPLLHSKLSVSGKGLTLTVSDGQSFVVNGQTVKKQSLIDGDVVEISGHKLKILAGDNGFDYLIDVDLDSDQITELKSRFPSGLKQIKAPRRKLTWALFLLLLGIGLVIPVVGLYVGMEKVREIPLVPDDGVWLTGELHQTHAYMGDNCTHCHTEAFTQTKNEDCLTCHQSVNHHFDVEKFGANNQISNDCGDCHKEHSSTDSITRTDQAGCASCHNDMDKAGFDSELRSATDFLDDHPSFMVSMHEWEASKGWQNTRVDLWADELEEKSNLIFPHDIHMSEQGIDGMQGVEILSCSDCHEPEKGGMKMKAVTMEQHCSDCHQLTFDLDQPDRVVPHGSPPDLMRTLREYYAYQFLNGDTQADASKEQGDVELPIAREARRPGRVARPKVISDMIVNANVDSSATLTEQANAYIEGRVEQAASNLFEKQTCTICHEISKSGDSAVPWQVKPVKLNEDWMPLAEFSHGGHKNMQCSGCHDAVNSTESSEVLMPDITSCRDCHGGEDSSNLLQSNCVTCHAYHLDDQPSMGALIESGNKDSIHNLLDLDRLTDEMVKEE
jgi:hypothetical protein